MTTSDESGGRVDPDELRRRIATRMAYLSETMGGLAERLGISAAELSRAVTMPGVFGKKKANPTVIAEAVALPPEALYTDGPWGPIVGLPSEHDPLAVVKYLLHTLSARHAEASGDGRDAEANAWLEAIESFEPVLAALENVRRAREDK